MQHSSIIVWAFWDDEASVWVASSTDIAGLNVEARTLELLNQKVLDALTDLIELNGFNSDVSEIPVQLLAEQFSRIPVPSH